MRTATFIAFWRRCLCLVYACLVPATTSYQREDQSHDKIRSELRGQFAACLPHTHKHRVAALYNDGHMMLSRTGSIMIPYILSFVALKALGYRDAGQTTVAKRIVKSWTFP